MSRATFRNRLAHFIANVAFRFIADDDYEREIEWYMVYARRSMRRDYLTGRGVPPKIEWDDESWRRFDTPA